MCFWQFLKFIAILCLSKSRESPANLVMMLGESKLRILYVRVCRAESDSYCGMGISWSILGYTALVQMWKHPLYCRRHWCGFSSSLGFVRARGGGDIRDVNTNSENWAVVKAALVAGMYPNLVHVDRENVVLTGPKEKKVRFHPTSVLSQPQYKKVNIFNNSQASRWN